MGKSFGIREIFRHPLGHFLDNARFLHCFSAAEENLKSILKSEVSFVNSSSKST